MPVKVRVSDNILVEVESEDDLRMVFAALGLRNGATLPAERAAGIDPRRQLFRSLRTKAQRTMLRSLAQSIEGLSDEQLRHALQIKSNNELAGTISGLTKRTKALGLKLGDLLLRERTGRRSYHYRLTPQMWDISVDQGWATKAARA